jgi:hypothetical protein
MATIPPFEAVQTAYLLWPKFPVSMMIEPVVMMGVFDDEAGAPFHHKFEGWGVHYRVAYPSMSQVLFLYHVHRLSVGRLCSTKGYGILAVPARKRVLYKGYKCEWQRYGLVIFIRRGQITGEGQPGEVLSHCVCQHPSLVQSSQCCNIRTSTVREHGGLLPIYSISMGSA